MKPPIQLALIGSGISHSKMPQLQEHLASSAGFSLTYSLIDSQTTPSFDLIDQVKGAQAMGLAGVNVTHPYKQLVCQVVSGPIMPGHERIGAYNTLVFRENLILGANTDYSGFISAYRFRRGNQNPGRVFLCGAGGVGHAIAWALAELDCEHLDIYDVNRKQAESLERDLNHALSVSVISEDAVAETVRACDGLINATSLGMHGHPGSAFNPALISQQSWAFDAVYTPLDTEFLQTCEAASIECLSGFNLWLFQGLDAFEALTGRRSEPTESLIQTTRSWF